MVDNNVNEELIRALDVTRLAMAQAYINQQRKYGKVGLKAIAESWSGQASLMHQNEWVAGTHAMIHYLRINNGKGAREALEVLETEVDRYEENARALRGINRKRGYKSSEMLRQAYQNICREFFRPVESDSGLNLHGAIRGAFSRFRRTLAQWRSSPSQ